MSALKKYGTYASGDRSRQRGMLINYDSLPGAVPNLLLPMFGVSVSRVWLETMARETRIYSKSRGVAKVFNGDSEDKQLRATAEIAHSAAVLMQPQFEAMEKAALKALKKYFPHLYEDVTASGSGSNGVNKGATLPNWKAIKTIPAVNSTTY